MPVDQFRMFESNKIDIAVNVFSMGEGKNEFYVLYISDFSLRRKHCVNLLLLENDEGKRHYVLIKHMSCLIHRRDRNGQKTYVCNSFLHPFMNERVLKSRLPYCLTHTAQQVSYPETDKEMFRLSFYLVCDFECFLKKSKSKILKTRKY